MARRPVLEVSSRDRALAQATAVALEASGPPIRDQIVGEMKAKAEMGDRPLEPAAREMILYLARKLSGEWG